MRTLPAIRDLWQKGGPFIGDTKPVTRVFVQEPWSDLSGTAKENDFLRTTKSDGVGSSVKRGVPMRWWQNQSNDQSMKEIPNILNVSIDRTIDQDAGTIDITLSNQWMHTNTATDDFELGQPGYFTWDRGTTLEAKARWNHETNEWNNVIVPNALFRVYTGYGGAREDYPNVFDAVSDGKLALYGVFLIDEVRIGTNGQIDIHGRDMAKLLIDQQLFPPLVPNNKYPLSYARWDEDHRKVFAAERTVPSTPPDTSGVTDGEKSISYRDSEVDQWYGGSGSNTSLNGHRPSDALDGNPASYYLSVGNSGPNKPFSTVWLEVNCNADMNAIYLHPWAGGYTCYVSVMEGGAWQGDNIVPYDYTPLIGNQPRVVDTGADIPYVASFTVPWEKPQDFVLPRAYNAERVRVAFRNLHDSGIGQWRYRAGVREFRVKGVASADAVTGAPTSSSGETVTQTPFTLAAGAIKNPDKTYSQGYVTATVFDQIDSYGDARRHAAKNYKAATLVPTAVVMTPTGEGYYILDNEGRVRVHGDAVWQGDPKNSVSFPLAGPDGYTWDMALTPSGDGYWVCATEGKVFAYGDATDWNVNVNVPQIDNIQAITSNPVDQGFWLVRTDGKVFTFGAAKHYGDWPYNDLRIQQKSGDTGFEQVNEQSTCIRSTSTGKGYWILNTSGRVRAFGDAKKFGQPDQLEFEGNVFTDVWRELIPSPDDRGYLLMHCEGQMTPFGDVEYFGSPVPGTTAILRSDGNYTDYAHIITDLVLWSGFLFYDPSHPSNKQAPVYGAIESTGAWAKERLPDDIFDKRPVIDAITQLREVVGYLAYVDPQGRFVFTSPNTWHIGNFNEDGYHIEYLPTVDERQNCTEYTVSTADDPIRSSVIISSHDPYADLSGTVTTRYTPQNAHKLRGIVKPAMWVNGFFVDETEQQLMAELIGLQIAFQERIGQVTCVGSPHIEPNDQVRILERQTSEVNVHYVRGVNFNHDLTSGAYNMTLTTHWLAAGEGDSEIVGGANFPASSLLLERIQAGQYGKYYVDTGEYLS